MNGISDLISAVQSPAAYGHAVEEITVIQTHISYVLLAGDFAYKIKKPVDFGFVDYSSLERRRVMCEEEVRLNRRLCDGVYLGVVPITSDHDGVRVDGSGEIIEYAVKMRRVPEARTMPSMLASGRVSMKLVENLASRVAHFHEDTPTSEHIATLGSPAAIRANWEENFKQTDRFIGRTVTDSQLRGIRTYIEDYLRQNASLFEQRVRDGRIRDCHGDLRADSVVFGDDGSVCVMDCIEFNERLRFGDVASDVAFLAMDLEARGFRSVAEQLISAYMDNVNDETLTLVFNFYRAYRAYIRGKVESLFSEEVEVPGERRARALKDAARYFDLSASYNHSVSSALVVMAGLSGSGKSWVAHPLAARMPAAIVRSDQVRRSMSHRTPGVPAFDKGPYSEQEREQVYDEMLRRAERYLDEGVSVVLDATFFARSLRERARTIAASRGAQFLVVETIASDAVIHERLDARGQGQSLSDARWETYLAQRERFEPINELAAGEHIRLDSSDDLVRLVDRAMGGLLPASDGGRPV